MPAETVQIPCLKVCKSIVAAHHAQQCSGGQAGCVGATEALLSVSEAGVDCLSFSVGSWSCMT